MKRRRFLTTAGASASVGLVGLAGFLGGNDYDNAADAAGDDTDWTTFGYDGRNTNYNPQETAPTKTLSERWRVESYRTTTTSSPSSDFE